MKRCALVLMVLMTTTAFAQTVTIPTARTVSSIPLLALEGQTIGGLTLATPVFDDHPLALAELIGGRTQVLQTGSSLAIKNAQAGGPLVQVATPVWDVSGLVTLDPNLKTLEDFEGKTLVAPLAGGPLDLQLQVLLRAKGLVGKVKVDYAEPAQAVALLLQKKVDGACLPEPLVSRLVVLNGARQLFTFAEAWATVNGGDGRAPQVSLVARRDWVQTHGAFLRAFLEAYRRSVAAVQADPPGVAQRFAPILGLPAPLVERGLGRTLLGIPSPSETQKLYQSYLTLVGDSKPLPEDFFFPE